jgi:succinate-semialdehyde dehydrogenase/glutarate-semialdehyde dehydrogenase
VTDQSAWRMPVPTDLLIGGTWRAAEKGDTFPVANPADGSVIAHVSDATPADAVDAISAASSAQAAWSATAPRTRSDILRRAYELLVERRQDFARLMTAEMGKPLRESLGEVAYGAEFLRWFSEEAVRINGRYGLNPEGTGRMIISKHPVGPCYLITPWNFPLAMATRKIAPALAAGCTVVIKPAELTPLTTLAFAALLVECGMPAGVVNVLTTTDPAATTAAILSDPRVRKLSFTGSTTVGLSLLAQASRQVLRASMELGGNAPFLIFEDADMDAAVDGAMAAKFRNIGQACTAANRFIVHESRAEEFTRRVTERVAQLKVGAGTEHGVTIGPLIDSRAVAKAQRLVADAVSRGAFVTVGGKALEGPGTYFAPTVLSDVASGSQILREEIFAPILTITTFRDEPEAVGLANDTEYGLVSYVYTRDLARAHRMIDSLETGMMGLNVGVLSNAAAPFGGVKQSGIGREGGLEGIGEYLVTKYTMTPSS